MSSYSPMMALICSTWKCSYLPSRSQVFAPSLTAASTSEAGSKAVCHESTYRRAEARHLARGRPVAPVWQAMHAFYAPTPTERQTRRLVPRHDRPQPKSGEVKLPGRDLFKAERQCRPGVCASLLIPVRRPKREQRAERPSLLYRSGEGWARKQPCAVGAKHREGLGNPVSPVRIEE